MDNEFYVYVWWKDGQPIYVGKGKNKRAYRNKDVDVEIYKNNLTEEEAFNLEKQLIAQFGRADKEEGTLLNLTDGGGISFSTLYWQGDELKHRHQTGVDKRSQSLKWLDGATDRARHATATRKADWQDSVYLVRTPKNEILEFKTQELKQYCISNGLDFDQMKHIARGNITKRLQSRHYGYLVEVLYNKVTGRTKDKQDIIKGWQR